MLFHAALVGVAAGFAGALFFGGLEYVQRFLLEDLAGYTVLRAHGARMNNCLVLLRSVNTNRE